MGVLTMVEKQKQSTTTSQSNKDKRTMKHLTKIKTLDLGNAQGFTCDTETGICGPVDQEKEENK